MIADHKPVIIGETAFHHQGDKGFLLQLIDAAMTAEVDVMKFHLLLDLDDYMVKDHQAREVLSKLCLSREQWDEVARYVHARNIETIFLCNDVKSIEWVSQLDHNNIIAIEIHATGINDVFLLEKASVFPRTVILGTGGSTIEEISFAVSYLRARGKNDLFLMHGFQNYPTQYTDIALSKMQALTDLFKLPVGYADHTDPNDPNNEIISCLGIGMGFNVLEKHFTTAFGEKRIDSQSAVSLAQVKKIAQLASVIWAARGNNPLAMSEGELKYGDTGPMKKALVARRPIQKGEVLTLDHMAYKRTNVSSYLKQNFLQSLLGQKASRDIQADEILDFSNIEFTFRVADFSQFKVHKK